MGVCIVVLVVGNQLEALRPEGAAEVPLPDRCVPMSASVSTHLCPGLQGGYVLFVWATSGGPQPTYVNTRVPLHQERSVSHLKDEHVGVRGVLP